MPTVQLDLQSVPLVGRELQLEQLDALLQESTSIHEQPLHRYHHYSQYNPLQSLLIQGSLGTGKSYLMEHWLNSQQDSHNLLFATGVFNLIQKHSIPYAAWTFALVELVRLVATRQNERLQAIIYQRMTLSDVQCLLDLIPQLGVYMRASAICDDEVSSSSSILLAESDTASSTHSVYTHSTFAATSVDRFAHLYCSLLACVCRAISSAAAQKNQQQQCVLWIDNVQWADDNSLELLKAILENDFGIENCRLILSERTTDDETNVNEQGVTRVACLVREASCCNDEYDSSSNNNDTLSITMTLNNLSVNDVNAMLSTVLELRPEETQSLATILYAKTLGNPLFIVQFLDLLQRQELLTYSLDTYKWTWDDETKLQESLVHVADNVASLVLEQIERLDGTTRSLLQIASYLGFSFDQDDLAIVWQGMSVVSNVNTLAADATMRCVNGMCANKALSETKIYVIERLQQCVSMRLLAAQANGWYSFTHNTIQAAFFEMSDRRINGDPSVCTCNELAASYLRLGFVILGLYRLRPDKKCKLFAAVEVLNRGVDNLADCHSKLTLAKLNLEAAEQAALRSAFAHAADYLSTAVDVIARTTDSWESDYDLTRHLYQRSAEVELVVGRHDRVKFATDIVVDNAKNDTEKVAAYIVLAKSLRIQSKLVESREIMLRALGLLGESFPPRASQKNLFWSRNDVSAILSMSNDQIAHLPTIRNKADRYRLMLLCMLGVNSYMQADHSFKTLVMRRCLSRTAQLGLCKASPAIFAFYAQALSHEGKYEDAFRFGELAVHLSKRKISKENRAIVIFFLVAFVDHLRKPLYQSLRLLEQGYHMGMASGDPESAFICAGTRLSFQDCCSYPLSAMMHDSAGYFRQARQCNQDHMAAEFLFIWQYTFNLAGESEDPLAFDGRILGEEAFMARFVHKGGVIARFVSKLQMQLYVFMDEWELATQIVSSIPLQFFRNLSGHYSFAVICTFSGLVWYKDYMRSKSRKALAAGNACRKVLERFVSKGCVNVTASFWLVEAQHLAVTNGKLPDVKEGFEKAIIALHRSGLRHLEAVACELLALHALAADDEELASDYIQRSYTLYRDWEAGAVLQRLSNAHGALLGDVVNSDARPNRLATRRLMSGSSTSFGRDSDIFDSESSWWSKIEPRDVAEQGLPVANA
ncbi:hypothetical protein MPSEU_000930300 [Mayamaea pseudoterrestris]|nr:hypothetical protein MPSEU_000930300 [Mayamaea pseudoterrestris]